MTEANTLTWTDQPKLLENYRIVSSFGLSNGTSVEIRADETNEGNKVFVTRGTLFGSQTIECVNRQSLYRALNVISEKKAKLPAGCKLIDSDQ